MARMIAHLSESELQALGETNAGIAEFTANNLSEILALAIDFEPGRLALIPFEVKDLKSLETYPAIARHLTDEGQFEISIGNIEFIFRYVLGSSDAEELESKHYSTILSNGHKALIAKVDNDFGRYLGDVLLQLDSNTNEDKSAIIAAIKHDEVESEQLERFIEKQSAILPSLDQIPVRLRSSVFRLRKIEPSWQNCMAYMASDDFDAETLTSFLVYEDTVSTLSAITVDDQESALPLRQFLLHNGDFSDHTYRAYVRALPKQFKQFPEDVELDKLRILVEEKAITFSASSFSFLEGKDDLQVLFVAGNIDLYFAEIEKIALDDEFREKLLNSNIGDDKKLKLIEHMDMPSLASAPNRASVVGQIFYRTRADLSHLPAEAAQAMVINAKPVTAQISLFNKSQKMLSDEQIWATIRQLPKPYSEIEPGWRQPTIPNTSENQDFVSWLESRSIISSSKPTYFGDEIRIYNKRK